MRKSSHGRSYIILGARYYEHAHRVSIWRPGMNIATKYAEKVRPDTWKFRQNVDTMDLCAIKWSRFMCEPRSEVVAELS